MPLIILVSPIVAHVMLRMRLQITTADNAHNAIQPVAGLGEALTIVDRMTVCHVIPMMRHLDITQVNVRTATIRMKIGITQASIMQV